MSKTKFLQADWLVPFKVKTLITTKGDLSDYGFNLALHVGDEPSNVIQNRKILAENLPGNPHWLNQTHSNQILDLDKVATEDNPSSYDASITSSRKKVCTVMTADCLPVLLTDTKASFVAAVHAGWRGVENGIITKTVTLSKSDVKNILVYIGPAICSEHFEVGQEVLDLFIQQNKHNKQFFKVKENGKYMCDLIGIAKLQLLDCGVLPDRIFLSNQCTYCSNDLFYSYRKSNKTGRFASCIWLE